MCACNSGHACHHQHRRARSAHIDVWALIASIADSVVVFISLVRIGDVGTVVLRVVNAVAIGVMVRWNQRDCSTAIANSVTVCVAKTVVARAQVACIADAIAIGI